MARGSALALAAVSLFTGVLSGVPECHYLWTFCLNSFNPHFADLVKRRYDGEYELVKEVPENQEVYCDADNWIKRSEICGPCAYTFEFTSGVPAEYIGLQHCIGALEKSPYIEESNIDIASPYNGREMRVVTHAVRAGCRTSDYADANLTDAIAFYNYMDSYGCGGGIAGGPRVLRELGNRLVVVMYTFHRSLTENEPRSITAPSQGIEDVVLMQAKAEAQDLPILKLLRAAAGDVYGKIVYHCGHDKPRGNLEAADLSEFGGGSCPWWFLSDGNICDTSPDPAKRLCTSCPLVMHDPVTREDLGCLWEPDLLPLRRHNSMAAMLAFPLQEKVLYIDADALPTREHLCDYDAWDEKLVRGRVVAFTPPDTSMRCARPDYAFHMMRAGVRAWVLPSERRLHGVGRNINLPIGTMHSKLYSDALRARFRERGVKLNASVYEMDVLFTTPPPTAWNTTPAPLGNEAGLTVDTETKGLMGEPVASVGVVMIAVASLGIVVKLGSGRASNMPLPAAARGLPLGLLSTLLSASLAVALAVVTFGLAERTGKAAEEAQRRNKDEAVMVMVLREDRITNDLMELYLKTTASILHVTLDLYRRSMERSADIVILVSLFNGDRETFDNWDSRVELMHRLGTLKDRTRFTTGVMLQVFMHNGWYYDDFGVKNSPASDMLNGTHLTLRETNQPLLHPQRCLLRKTAYLENLSLTSMPGWSRAGHPAVTSGVMTCGASR